MLKDEIEIRLEAIEWSKNLHQKHKEQADVIIKNVGTLSDLSSNIRNFADMLISKPDYSRPNQ
jgi:transcriptional regulator of NAD metabolism